MLLKLQPTGEQASVSFMSTTAGNSSTCEGQPALRGVAIPPTHTTRCLMPSLCPRATEH